MKWMNLHHLKYFLVIAEEGSISAASRKLLVGQPALSAQLKQFEDSLGQKLFRRENKGLIINDFGKYVLKYAKAIKSLEDELLFHIEYGSTQVIKDLTVGAQESVPKSMLAAAIEAINKTKSHQIKVIEGTGTELFNLLISGKIDIFIGNFKPLSEGKEMSFVSLGKEKVSFWASPKMASLKMNFPFSLEGQNFILPGLQNPLRHEFEKYMSKLGISFNLSVEAQDSALQKELAGRGHGVVVLGDKSAKLWAKSGRLIRLGPAKNLEEEYWIGMVKRAIDNAHIDVIMSSLRKM
jgi:LysR family transcriptional activator of nhaA